MKKFTLLLLSLVFALSTIALAACKHEHEFSESWIAGDTSHYYECECGEKKDEASHVFDNACDTTCNYCGKTRSTSHSYATTLTAGDTTHYYACACGAKKDEVAHVFDSDCDTTCDDCGKTRTITHNYSSTLTAGETTHYYACACGAKKDEVAHSYASTLTAGDTTHYYACECGAKNDEVEHVFAQVKNDTTFVSETDTTATYKKSCTCGKLSNETFTVDKIVTQITNMKVEYEYSGGPVDLVFDINSNGAVTYVWYEDGDSTPLSEVPDFVGEFSVYISVAGTREYTAVEEEYFGFEITPKLLPVPTVLTKTYDGTSIFTYTFDETATGTGESVTVKLDMRDRNPESNPVKNAGTYDETTADLWATFYWGGTNTETSCYDFVDEYYHNQVEYDITINKKVLEGTMTIRTPFYVNYISYDSTQNLYYTRLGLNSSHGIVAGEAGALRVYVDSRDINANFVKAELLASDSSVNVNYIYDSTKLSVMEHPLYAGPTTGFNSALTFDCKTAQSYNNVHLIAGQKVYIKINGAGGTLNDFYFKATTGSTATFTWEYYDATDLTTPEYAESTATDTAFVDICDTEDCYLVVTCVTGGEVSITSSL